MKIKIVITGHSKGIGREIAKNLIKLGYEVVGISRSTSNIKNLSKEYKCDISDYSNVKKIFKKIKKFNILINNSSITKFSKNYIKNFDKIVKVNLSGTFYCSYESFKYLEKNSSIINISSINAYQAFPNNPGYVASKGGVRSLTQSLALDFANKNIRVNSISPGYFNIGMGKLSYKNSAKRKKRLNRMIINRWGEAKDLFGLINYLISNESSYVTGQDFVVDGGWLAKGL